MFSAGMKEKGMSVEVLSQRTRIRTQKFLFFVVKWYGKPLVRLAGIKESMEKVKFLLFV